MLGVQLNFDGERLVVCNGVVVGVMTDDNTEDCLGVLRILGNEYAEQVRLIQLGVKCRKGTDSAIVSSVVLHGELIINVKRDIVAIKDILSGFCYPMKTDNLVITYVTCKKVYTIKQSAIYVKRELQRLGVIK